VSWFRPKWRRPYRLGTGLYAIAVFLVFVEYQAIVVTDGVVRSHGVAVAVKLIVGFVVLTVPAAICARLARVGVYTGRAGLKYVGPTRTKTVAWPAIGGMEVTDGPMPRQLVIRQVDGAFVQLPILFKGSAFLLGGASTEVICERLNGELSRHEL
jgi:hypothetical protein